MNTLEFFFFFFCGGGRDGFRDGGHSPRMMGEGEWVSD